ncbi:solute carrier family 35 member B1-like isoform X2 [Mizuhopecten yessoensis]|uniref:solute carrier family 35 member B1-like isoform X2 n=1 Tax=Mizuhopecten yessoensis TaxID=6573 RepID=UPI000B457C9B|nr:solute carrier family 35 member B1-like isoform X2 [Mizuhopecten yessoensis]
MDQRVDEGGKSPEGQATVLVSTDPAKIEKMYSATNTKLAVCAVGTFLSYFVYGLLQESITKGKYGEREKTEKFTYTTTLVFMQCIANALAAKLVLMFWKNEKDSTPAKLYGLCSLSYLGAMLASNKALQFVNYPTQVLGKSAKPIPVMILGILFARKRYPAAKFLFVLMIVIGVAMFLYKDKAPTSKGSGTLFGFGELLLLVSLTLDGLTGATQERMRTDHMTGAYSMMLNVNLWSLLWSAIGLFGTGEILEFLVFAQNYPSVLLNMLYFGVASAIGQMFIFTTVTCFGPLTCSIITTTRKFFTIFASVLIFQNPMNSRQWLGTVFVFTGLGLDSAYGKEKKKR